MQGRAGQEVARNFVEAVERKLELLNDRKDRVIKVAFGGRDVAVQSAGLPEHQVLHVLPYHGAEGEFDDPENLLEAGRFACKRWWQKFGEAVGKEYDDVPKALQDNELTEITAQPLLNYLLALSYRRGQLDFSTAPNLNLIYRDLLDAVYERRWGPGRHPTRKQLRREEFDDLLDELGLAAWHGAGRTVTETEVEQACERAGLQKQLAAFQEGARAGAISLLAAFYFRQASKIEGERTFEFTHKSFGEYLIARRLVRTIEDIHDDRELNRKNRQRGKTLEDALARWTELTGSTALDSDLLAFLKRQIVLRGEEHAHGWRYSLSELFNDQLTHGLPMHRLQIPTYQEMVRQARNAEEALLAAHFCCASAVEEPSPIEWPNAFGLRDLLNRLDQGYNQSMAYRCLGWLGQPEIAAGQFLPYADLNGATLEGAELAGATLWRTSLIQANLAGADLTDAELSGANLMRSILDSADLSGAELGDAILEGASIRAADLEEAILEEANLEGANLTGANLKGANLDNVNLRGATPRGTILDGANLEGADLRGADLTGAILVGAILEGVTIERKWAFGLKLDVEQLGLGVVADLDRESGNRLGKGAHPPLPRQKRSPGLVIARRLD